MTSPRPVLRAVGLGKDYPVRGDRPFARRALRAVERVDLDLMPGTTLGVLGESGCGKSTLAAMLTGQTAPTRGRVELLGRDLAGLDRRERRRAVRDVQLVHQDPTGALDPRMSVADSVAEPLHLHPDLVPRAGRRAAVLELLDLVGLDPDHADRLPHQFSGGQRQRVAIARALALRPRVVVCDEPVSALDVSVQAQVVNLLLRLQRDLGLAYVVISHDLSVVAHMADRVAVMYLGRVVEQGPARQVEDHPAHPYTAALHDAVPAPDRTARTPAGTRARRPVPGGQPPDPASPPPGCAFHPRCQHAVPACREAPPATVPVPGPATDDVHLVACLSPWSAGATPGPVPGGQA